MSSILITGGNGYVGRALTRRLYDDHTVTVFDSLRWKLRFSPAEQERFRFVQGDITDERAIAEAIADAQPDAVVHLAAIHFIPECDANPLVAVHTNALGTAAVARACPGYTRLIYASSAAVYAPSSEAHVEDVSPIDPSDIYGLTKLHGEHFVRHWAAVQGFEAITLRLFNVVGPGETNPHLLPTVVAQVRGGATSLSLGNLDPRRDYVHVADVVDAFVQALAVDPASVPGGAINIGSGATHSVTEVLEIVGHCAGRRLRVDVDERRVRAVDRPILAADVTKARAVLGWSPSRTIQGAIGEMMVDDDFDMRLGDMVM